MIAGHWRWRQYEEAFAKGLEENGADVAKFVTSRYFTGQLGRVQL